MTNLLQSYLVDRNQVTVSGISAGAYMAHQLHVAYSDIFKGAGLIAGGPFMMSSGSIFGAFAHGLKGVSSPTHQYLANKASMCAKSGWIANLNNLSESRVFVLHGTEDKTVKRSVSDALVDFYEHFTAKENIEYCNTLEVVHAMPTVGYGASPLKSPKSPYIVASQYDAAGKILQHLSPLHELLAPIAALGELVEFDQTDFIQGATWMSMDKKGFAYIPRGASNGEQCSVHVALHGCKQHRGAIGNEFAQHAGYNEWAESNNIIILYPQASAQSNFGIFNPMASFDWWGFTGPDYAFRTSRQMRSIVNMVQRVSGQDFL
jgi:poly(3-hydroxybutyrate) depolymerase